MSSRNLDTALIFLRVLLVLSVLCAICTAILCSVYRYLTDQKEINLNVRDKWDSTPLYYSCLCGHPEVVSYLLENGARCDANTFDGERCVYGALTDQIRKMLLNFSVISSRVKR